MIDPDDYPYDEEDPDEDPSCSDCGCDLQTEYHAWDCAFVDDDFDDDDEEMDEDDADES